MNYDFFHIGNVSPSPNISDSGMPPPQSVITYNTASDQGTHFIIKGLCPIYTSYYIPCYSETDGLIYCQNDLRRRDYATSWEIAPWKQYALR